MSQRTEELFRLRFVELERVVKQLVQPKSRTRLLLNNTGPGWVEGIINDIRTASSGVPEEAPYTGLIIATISVVVASCGREYLIGEDVDIVDHAGCILDLAEEDLIGVYMWGWEGVALSLEPGAPVGTLTPCHFSNVNRCCTPAG